MTTAARLLAQRTRLASLEAEIAAIEKRDADRHWTALDSATGSGIRRKVNHKADRARFARYDREADLYKHREATAQEVARLETMLSLEEFEAVREHFDAKTLAGASLVRDRSGWHKVAKVNKTTVSVETGYSWTDRLAFDKILGAACLTSTTAKELS